ncbi:MAG: type II toxin-antitoxin system VapC family toxin [Acidobacteriia bacterium]|nr:type II toxin-antitoxin system VapC family toxin [Terriglobia bacterium]
MVIDTSAIVAILFGESERETFLGLLAAEPLLVISVVTFHESSIVTAQKKRSPAAAQLVDNLTRDLAIEMIPLDVDGAGAARDAYFRYGRGWHSAGLNLADCFSYSLAKSRDEPLLFKGSDFLQTDVVAAWRS